MTQDTLARPVAGYLRVYRRYQAIQARLDHKLDAVAPLRRQAAELRDQLKVREGRLTGGQLAAVRRGQPQAHHVLIMGDDPPLGDHHGEPAIVDARAQVTALLNATDALENLNSEYATDLGASMQDSDFVDGDAGLVKNDIAVVLGTPRADVKTAIDSWRASFNKLRV